jgi:spermidine synthase
VEGRKFLFLTVFIAGMSTLAVEFVASRMLQTVYGTSNIVWANVIGLVLLFLTVGYFLGGKIADRNPSHKLFYWMVCAAGFSSVFFLLLTSITLRSTTATLASYDVGAVAGSLIGVILAIAIPITLLGCLSPFAIRLAVRDVSESGRISGIIYAISTLGSLAGTYLPVLYVIPTWGSRVAAVVFGSALLTIGLAGLWIKAQNRWAPLVLPLVLAPFSYSWMKGNIKNDPQQLFETESEYNYVAVKRRGRCNYLLLNESLSIQSYYCDDGRYDYDAFLMLLATPYFTELQDLQHPIDSLAIIGLGGGTVPKRFEAAFGKDSIHMDGIELDPAVVRAGIDYLDMTEPRLTAIVGDGRYEMNQLGRKYDMMVIDAYKPPYIPWHMTTVEFFQEVYDHLNEGGAAAVNVFRFPDDRRLVEAITATILKVFPTIHTLDVGLHNTLLVATREPSGMEFFRKSKEAVFDEANPMLKRVLLRVEHDLVPTVASDVVFTDQVAPLEPIIDSMILRQLLRLSR